MKRIFVSLLALLLPIIYAQGLFVSEHEITYRLTESDYVIEETLNFENLGNPNLFKDTIYFDRGNARDVEVGIIEDVISSSYEVKTDVRTTIVLNLVLWKGDKKKLIMKYRRSDALYERDSVTVFEGFALGKYPWIINSARIRFLAPDNYQFGALQPKGAKSREENRESLSYALNVFENLSEIQDGLPVKIEYAKFKDLAIPEFASSKALITEASYALQDANASIENAKNYEANLSAALLAYNSSLASMQRCREQIRIAEILFNPPYREYYESRNWAMNAGECAREVERKAAEARNGANFEIQRALEWRISKISSNITQQSEQLEKNLTLKLAELKTEERSSGGEWWFRPAALMLFSVVLAIVLISMARASKRNREFTRPRGSAEDFRVIGDLKYRKYEGFEKKVDAVKKGVEIAAEIRKLQHERGKYVSGIENLRKKRLANEISEVSFELENHKFGEELKEIDVKIEVLQKDLRGAKEIKEQGFKSNT